VTRATRARRGGGGAGEHGSAACGVDGEITDLERRRGRDRALDGLGDVVELEVEQHLGPALDERAHDVQLLTVHAGGGLEMLRAAEQSAQQTAAQSGRNAPLVLGVTVLTSMDANALSEVGCESNVGGQVERLAALAV